MNSIIVSVCCITYNQVDYIRESLEGFLMQKCNFAYDVLIHDDASTDGTADIIKEYQQKYPNIIKPVLQTENQYSKGNRAIQSKYNFSRAQGKYIAMCEGDDYWTDPLKLQKQLDFLEGNIDYSLCFTNAEVQTEGGINRHYSNLYNHLRTKDYSGQEIYEKWSIPTASIMFRNSKPFDIPSDKRFVYGDIVLFLWQARKGRIKCINEKMVVYRRNEGGVTFIDEDYRKFIDHHEAIKEHFGLKYQKSSDKNMLTVYINAFLSGKLNRNSFLVLKDIFENPRFLLPFILKLPVVFSKVMLNKIK